MRRIIRSIKNLFGVDRRSRLRKWCLDRAYSSYHPFPSKCPEEDDFTKVLNRAEVIYTWITAKPRRS